MQKVTAILEKNVEWVALGIAGLFFLFMLYSYIVLPPVTATVGSAPVTPGEVDPKILAGPAKDLERKMSTAEVPKFVVKDFGQDLQEVLANKNVEIQAIAGAYGPSNIAPEQLQARPQPGTPGVAVVPGQPGQPGQPNPTVAAAAPVTVLPVPPAPANLQFSQGRSNVTIPAPAAPGSPNPAASTGTPTDRNWVTVSGLIPMKGLADEWTKRNIPPQPNTTTILRVEMVRQELDPTTDNWGPETVLPPLQNVNLQPLPPVNANPTQAQAYQQWAETTQIDLLQPPFYAVTQGDPWLFPGQALLQPDQINQAFDPSKVQAKDIATLTPDQKKLYDDYRKAEAERKRQEQRQRYQQTHPKSGGGGGGAAPYGPPGGRGGPGGDSTSYAPRDPERPITLAQVGRGRISFDPEMEAAPVPYGPGGGPAAPNQPPPQPGQPVPGPVPPIGPVPNPGSFDPIALSNGQLPNGQQPPPAPVPVPAQPGAAPAAPALNPGDVTIWAHDDSVQPGHTYRYKLRYIIRNPVFQTRNVCKPQTLADQFLINSTESDWTPRVSVKSETNLFAASTSPLGDRVKFDIFRWKNGNWQMQKVEVTPGDMVGSTQGQGPAAVDFKTGLTLVDVRQDPKNSGNRIILLTGDNGQIVLHNTVDDRNSDERKRLMDEIQKNVKPPGNPTASAGT